MDSTETEKKKPCMCNGQEVDQTICDLLAEYEESYWDPSQKRWETPKWTPRCSDFRQSGGTTFFSWNELNGYWGGGNESEHKPYGLIRQEFLFGLLVIRVVHNASMPITSGYRCPAGNDEEGSKFKDTSRHMYGMAADVSTGKNGGNKAVHDALAKIRVQYLENFTHTAWGVYSGGHIHFQIKPSIAPPYPLTGPSTASHAH